MSLFRAGLAAERIFVIHAVPGAPRRSAASPETAPAAILASGHEVHFDLDPVGIEDEELAGASRNDVGSNDDAPRSHARDHRVAVLAVEGDVIHARPALQRARILVSVATLAREVAALVRDVHAG